MTDKSKSRLGEDLERISKIKSDFKRPPASETSAFNGLSHAESERLAVLIEELAEAQQAIGKILRFGFDSTHPEGGPTNRRELEKELGDVRNAERMLVEAGDLNNAEIQLRAQHKAQTIGQYLHHQPE
ncbi:hypothetical protein [Marinobacter salicampi]|uniref:hypothetical protein n=1 Tax=Marinobacter salicampi TaxID=435907 RepID=UPI0014088DF1|nr:hypothetical protein [Marinobacter salicampi]